MKPRPTFEYQCSADTGGGTIWCGRLRARSSTDAVRKAKAKVFALARSRGEKIPPDTFGACATRVGP